MIALGTMALLQHPDALARQRGSDDRAENANIVDELLRYLTVVHITRNARGHVAFG